MINQLLLFMKMNKLVNEKNLQFMREAFKEVFLLKRIRKDLFPNQAQIAYDKREVPIGCVFVHNDKIVGRGRNMTNETGNVFPHASRFFHLNGIIIVCYREPDMQNWQQLIKCSRLITLIQNCSKKQICIYLGIVHSFLFQIRHYRAMHHVCQCSIPIRNSKSLFWSI